MWYFLAMIGTPEVSGELSAARIRQNGVRVYRDIVDPSGLEAAQAILCEEFGDAVKPFEDVSASGLSIVSRRESAKAFLGARAAGSLMTTGGIMTLLQDTLPQSVTRPLVSKTNGFNVMQSKVAHDLINLRVADNRHFRHRGVTTALFNEALGEPYPWRRLNMLVPIGRLIDKSAADDIRKFNDTGAVRLSFGELQIHRRKQ